MSTATTDKGSWLSIPLVARANAGTLGSIVNPEGEILIITRAVLYIDTDTSDAGTTLNVGVGAASTTDNNALHAAIAIDGSAGTAYQGYDAADAGDTLVMWPVGQYVTTTSSAAATAFVGRLDIEYIHA